MTTIPEALEIKVPDFGGIKEINLYLSITKGAYYHIITFCQIEWWLKINGDGKLINEIEAQDKGINFRHVCEIYRWQPPAVENPQSQALDLLDRLNDSSHEIGVIRELILEAKDIVDLDSFCWDEWEAEEFSIIPLRFSNDEICWNEEEAIWEMV